MAMSRKEKRVVYWSGDHGYDLGPRVRELSVQDWRNAGVFGEGDPKDGVRPDRPGVKALAWNLANNFRVPLSELDFLNSEEFARFILADPFFTVEGEAPPAEDTEG